ncbi:MAG: GNAT family N-acetyltransferase [Chloroflexi bacterium]|nr:GNAT family N-acetyltransferase [Chloroflexota bacterium]
MVSYDLRPATEADYEFLYRLHAAAIRPSVEAMWGWDETFQREYFRTRWDPAGRRIIVVDDEDVGALILDRREGSLYLALIEIHPNHQNRGVGAAVIRDVLALGRALGLPVKLHVLKTNPAARRLYQRLGFRVIDSLEDRYVMIANVDRDKKS